MGILDQLERRDLKINDPKAWNPSLWNLAGSQSLSGENVTEETALTYSAVWNAVQLIAGTIATLPLHLYRKTDTRKAFAEDQNLYWVMHSMANPYMTAKTFRETIMMHVLTWGNGYAEKVRNQMGEVTELWPIAPNRTEPKMQNGKLVYAIRMSDGSIITLPRERVLHIPGPSPDGFMGYSIIGLARKSIGLGMALETFGSLYFGNGTHPGIVVTHPGKLDDAAHSNLKKSLTESYSGLGQSHRLMLLEDGMKMDKVGIPPEDSQFLESRQFQIPEIARWFNIPPHKLKDLTKSSFNNIEEEEVSFMYGSILPWLVGLEQLYNMQLLSSDEYRKQRLYFKHVMEGILRANAKDRGEFYKAMFSVGMTMNQILEKEDMDPIDHEFADTPWVPMNMIPITLVREYIEKSIKKNGGKQADQEPGNTPEPNQPDKIKSLMGPEKDKRLILLGERK